MILESYEISCSHCKKIICGLHPISACYVAVTYDPKQFVSSLMVLEGMKLIIGFNMVKWGLLFLGLTMTIGSSVLFLEDIEVLLSSESAHYLSKISNANKHASILFLLIYAILLFFFWKTNKFFLSILCLIVFCLWLISGRTITFKYFPDGRIVTGWYYFETNKFYLSQNNDDYESVITKETSIERVPIWSVKIKNKTVDKTIFIGPFTWGSALEILEKNIGIYQEAIPAERRLHQ